MTKHHQCYNKNLSITSPVSPSLEQARPMWRQPPSAVQAWAQPGAPLFMNRVILSGVKGFASRIPSRSRKTPYPPAVPTGV
jgi:hypothetical protein